MSRPLLQTGYAEKDAGSDAFRWSQDDFVSSCSRYPAFNPRVLPSIETLYYSKSMQVKIDWSTISPEESEKLKDELAEVWEASVRSTHHFLTEKDILFYKPLVRNEYIPAVELYVIRN